MCCQPLLTAVQALVVQQIQKRRVRQHLGLAALQALQVAGVNHVEANTLQTPLQRALVLGHVGRVLHAGKHLHLPHKVSLETQLLHACLNRVLGMRRAFMLERCQQHQQHIPRRAVVKQRKHRRVGRKTTVPVGLALNLNRVVNLG